MTETMSIEEFKDLKSKGVISKKGRLVLPEKTIIPKLAKPSKYRNKKVVVDNITFDSIKESKRNLELKDLKYNHKIADFERQVRIPLEVNNIKICSLIIDFRVYSNDGTHWVEDVKGLDKKTGKYQITKDCRIKHKLFEALYNQKIILV
jgi:hypothetical protein